jgi:hypothetical protein
MNRGFTIVWSGWQGDITPGGDRLTFSTLTVPQVTGLALEEFVFDHLESLAFGRLSYPAADLDPAHAKLTVRARAADLRTTPNDLSFNFEAITRPAGFDARAIYELIYLAKDPKVVGLGFAAGRDVVSYLRHETADAAGNTNVLAGQVDFAIGFGLSQSGRYLHDFLYWGFNTDEAGRPVFEGLMPHIAGGKKTFTNYRFSQPGRSPYRHTDTVYPDQDFPLPTP